MAKLLFIVAAFLVSLAVVAEANTVAAPAPAPVPHHHHHHVLKGVSVKLILHNTAKRAVTFKLVSPLISKPVVALPHKWTAIKPTPITSKHTHLHVVVVVENKKHVTVTKNLKINLLQHFKPSDLKGEKYLVLTAVESWSWKSKYLLITMGEVVVLSIKL